MSLNSKTNKVNSNKNTTARPKQHGKKHNNKTARTETIFNVVKKIITSKKNTGGRGENRVFILMINKHGHTSILGASKAPTRTNKHSQNAKK